MLDKVAGVLKKKRKNQRDTLLRVALVFLYFFYDSSSLIVPFTVTSSLSIVCFLPLSFPTPSQERVCFTF